MPEPVIADRARCEWCRGSELYERYHDDEWGVPVHDDRVLFEMLNLEGAQAGLSWLTILKKRDNYRSAFDQFDCRRIAEYDDAKVAALMADAGIVRHRLKIQGVIANARATLKLYDAGDTLDSLVWRFVEGRPVVNNWRFPREVPGSTKVSDSMSRELKRRGFTFVGTTICYAFMQAVGLVDDHLPACWRRQAGE